MGGDTIRLDLRAVLPIAALALIILIIIFIELCGREDIEPGVQAPDQQEGLPTATLGPTFTPGPSPTIGPTVPTATLTPMPGGRDRDALRVQDLQELQDLLAEYFDDNDEYPNNEGSIQTLCVFPEFDVGCDLLELQSQLPEDPLGESSINGYWYSSNGESYTLYAQRESDSFPACLDHPEFLQDFDSVLCFSGP